MNAFVGLVTLGIAVSPFLMTIAVGANISMQVFAGLCWMFALAIMKGRPRG